MSNMIVRPPQSFLDGLGNPAVGWRVFIGKPNTDPTLETDRIDITDGVGGEIVSNPFYINQDGQPMNANGQVIVPVIAQQQYSMVFQSQDGGILKRFTSLIGDGLSGGGGGSGGVGIPDFTFNNLDQAKAFDLSGENFIFIKASASGWEGTASGSNIASFYYRNGTSGTPSSGDANKFYDSQGNGWVLAKSVTEKALESQIDAIPESYFAGNLEPITLPQGQYIFTGYGLVYNGTDSYVTSASLTTGDDFSSGSFLANVSADQLVTANNGNWTTAQNTISLGLTSGTSEGITGFSFNGTISADGEAVLQINGTGTNAQVYDAWIKYEKVN